MNTLHAQRSSDRPVLPSLDPLPAQRSALEPALPATRETASGHLSLIDFGCLAIDAEPGLVIRVHGGRLWVPPLRHGDGVGVGPGEEVVVPCAGPLAVLATARTHIELAWPPQ